ncbi:hypothetical protein C1645_755376 [Glomus cerebriforme]|uniref:Uncharacterized protein n=1 Tax=Glomus cerebriforme TaxID=658196 RepID=A0A397TMS9_9GLOM|nr:hypothetical protein C1645_755376 [Glomus cerebriforme]
MAERFDSGFWDTIHEKQDNNSFRSHGEDDIHRRFSADPGHYGLGHSGSSLELCPSTSKGDDVGRTNRVSNEKPGTICSISNENTTRAQFTPFNSQRYILEGDAGTRDTMHVRRINSLSSASEQRVSGIESEEYEDVTVGVGCARCSNKNTIGRMFSLFGKLRRVNSLESDAQFQSRGCRFIYTHSNSTQEKSTIDDQGTMPQVSVRDENDGFASASNNSSILVNTFADRSRFASFIDFKFLTDSEAEDLTDYIARVEEFGFNHIIIIGEVDFGMIFLDCYGRIFKWDDESQILWPLGDLEDPLKYPEKLKRGEGWSGLFIKNGTVHEISY